jgi:S1-C subfamily serine protease
MTHQEVEILIGKPTFVTKTDTSLGRLEICDYAVATMNRTELAQHTLASSENLNEDISMSVVYNHGRVLHIQRNYIDITSSDIVPHPSKSKLNAGLHVDKNMVVTGIDVNSPASKAGIQVSDIILAFDGVTISDIATLRKLTDGVKYGDKKRLRVQREGKIVDLTIVYPQGRGNK